MEVLIEEQKSIEIEPRLFLRSFVIEPLTSDIIQFVILGYFFVFVLGYFSILESAQMLYTKFYLLEIQKT